jgi:hypothetical protein
VNVPFISDNRPTTIKFLEERIFQHNLTPDIIKFYEAVEVVGRPVECHGLIKNYE